VPKSSLATSTDTFSQSVPGRLVLLTCTPCDLAAAVVLRDRVSETELRRFLRAELATFKVPARIVEVARLPRSTGGKVERGELAAVLAASIQPAKDPPIGREETEVARIFADVLKAPVVGREDNFFDLGGESLSAMQVLAAVEATLGVPVALEVLFDHPTVSAFAAAILRDASLDATHRGPGAILGKIERRR